MEQYFYLKEHFVMDYIIHYGNPTAHVAAAQIYISIEIHCRMQLQCAGYACALEWSSYLF